MGSFQQAGARVVVLALLVAPLTGCGEERPALPTGPTGAGQEPPPTVTAVAPTVTAVAPDRGPVGSTVLITGTGFSPGAKIIMGDAATNVVVFNSTLIEATAPLGASGTVDVIVMNPNGQRAVLDDAYTYEIKPPPLPPLPRELTFVWVVVLEGGGSELCIPGATVEIGTRAGPRTASYAVNAGLRLLGT